MNGAIDLKCPNGSCRGGYLAKSFSGCAEFKCGECGLIVYIEIRKLPRFVLAKVLTASPL